MNDPEAGVGGDLIPMMCRGKHPGYSQKVLAGLLGLRKIDEIHCVQYRDIVCTQNLRFLLCARYNDVYKGKEDRTLRVLERWLSSTDA